MYFRWIVDSEESLAFLTCRQPMDLMHLPNAKEMRISFAHCKPAKHCEARDLNVRAFGHTLGVRAGIKL